MVPPIIEGMAVGIEAANVDTDQIIPARFLLKSRDAGYGSLLFRDQRFTAGGMPRAAFPLDRDLGEPVRFLIANDNFGCGSAREQAVYALSDFGIRVVVAPSFGEIFRQNCVRNGVVPALVSAADAATLRQAAGARLRLHIDVPARLLTAPGIEIPFALSHVDGSRLLGGRDEIDETLELESKIAAYEDLRLASITPR
jgi:3-isopropylmalate/(R)-2-methylmalate dehydratase small subunit